MNQSERDYNMPMKMSNGYQPPSVQQKLEAEAMELHQRLEKVEAALEALEKNPGITAILNLVSEVYPY